ncbi:Thiamine-phosphate synthase [compost metagenome]
MLRATLRQQRPELPVGAIAGIDLARTPEVIAAGADGIAVISAIFRASDIGAATRNFRNAVDAALTEKRQ